VSATADRLWPHAFGPAFARSHARRLDPAVACAFRSFSPMYLHECPSRQAQSRRRRVRRVRPLAGDGRPGGIVGAATRKALTAMTVTVAAYTRTIAGQAAAAAVDSPSYRADAHGRSRSAVWGAGGAAAAHRTRAGALAVRLAGDATTEDLLRRSAGLPAGHPGRVELRVRGIEAGLPLARRLATRYQGRGEPLDDLYQVAALALVKAVDGYDPARDVAFTSYAVPTIVGALKRHFRDTTWRVRVPRPIQELAVRLGPTVAVLTQQLDRSPSVAELAAHLDAAEEVVAIALNAWRFRHPESLDALSATGRGEQRQPVIDSIGAVDARFDAVIDWHLLQPLLAALPERERRIVAMRYFGDLTQAEIAARLGLSQMHISRLLVHTLTQLRAGILAEPSPAPRRAPGHSAVRRA